MAISFSNPIEDMPPVEAEAELDLFPSDAGGLKSPLELPSPSLVFRDLDAEEIVGYTVMIGDDAGPHLQPGTTTRCHVTFIGVPAEKVSPGRRFALWQVPTRGAPPSCESSRRRPSPLSR